jgi:hypothetical protein
MRPRLLLPYAVVAIVIAVGSSVAVVATARPSTPGANASVTPAPSATASRATPELARTSRLAYWRDGKLWVSNLDGSVRYSIASVDDMRRVSLLRWSTDGGAVAYVDSGITLVVVTTTGDRISVGLPQDLAADRGNGGHYQIKDLRWSPSGDRIAATVLRPTDGRSDAFVVDLTGAPRSWTRVTMVDDLFVADWISDDDFLGYTSGGAIVAVTATEGERIRLLSGSTGVSPIVAPDGRIHFLLGRVTTRDPSFPFQTASRASVWSSATDGSDLRRETTWAVDDIRLDARLPDGRYLVHRGSSNALGTVTDDVVLLPSSAGVVERVRVAPDGRTAYGFTPDKIVRIDLTKLVASSSATPSTSMTVFLDTSGESDVWFPSQLSLARGGAPVAVAPAALYAFTLGGHTWRLEKGVATLFRAGPIRRAATPSPRWSPSGDRLLVEENAAAGGAPLVAIVLDRDGKATRLSGTLGAGRSYAWSPSGSELAIAVDRRGTTTTGSPQLEIRFFDPTGRATRTAVPGTEVAWTRTGLFVLADTAGAARQTIEKIDGDTPARALTTAAKLLSDPRSSPVSGRTGGLSTLDAAPDGSFASARMQVQDPGGARSYIVVVGADGTAAAFARADDLTDVAWSPSSALLGYTLGLRTADEHAIVITPAGVTVATQDGRFAGWSPDAKWYLVARTGTLYAYPVAGGSAVRLGPAAAPVSATPSR